ncbi:hypothetical protein D9611_012181 [Ephemerocybe angulata]|uniref:Uncharacterized protein n=1 Tax=Ephemerocybe angulata TaxID=980116 RepID=A0A8H5FG45_9AGAR|nr:hypothetical protein D9611_012181 [Tulosesus angulatus]
MLNSFFSVPAVAAFLSLITLPSALAQDPLTANSTATLVTWSTNQCCGGNIAFNRVKAGDCVKTVGHPSIYGASITTSGFWGDGRLNYGYLTGFKDGSCSEKAYEIRYDGCVSIGPESRASSWKWTQETYVPPIRRRELVNVTGAEVADGAVITKASWFSYFDQQEGRERRIALDDEQEASVVLKMYEDKDFEGLSRLYEYNRR